MSGTKDDQDKSRVDLLVPEFLDEIGKVLGFGAKKYGDHNWKGGIYVTRLMGAALRHIIAFNEGQDLDPESGRTHLAHAACNLMFVGWMQRHRPSFDDRGVSDEYKAS